MREGATRRRDRTRPQHPNPVEPTAPLNTHFGSFTPPRRHQPRQRAIGPRLTPTCCYSQATATFGWFFLRVNGRACRDVSPIGGIRSAAQFLGGGTAHARMRPRGGLHEERE